MTSEDRFSRESLPRILELKNYEGMLHFFLKKKIKNFGDFKDEAILIEFEGKSQLQARMRF